MTEGILISYGYQGLNSSFGSRSLHPLFLDSFLRWKFSQGHEIFSLGDQEESQPTLLG